MRGGGGGGRAWWAMQVNALLCVFDHIIPLTEIKSKRKTPHHQLVTRAVRQTFQNEFQDICIITGCSPRKPASQPASQPHILQRSNCAIYIMIPKPNGGCEQYVMQIACGISIPGHIRYISHIVDTRCIAEHSTRIPSRPETRPLKSPATTPTHGRSSELRTRSTSSTCALMIFT